MYIHTTLSTLICSFSRFNLNDAMTIVYTLRFIIIKTFINENRIKAIMSSVFSYLSLAIINMLHIGAPTSDHIL